MSEGIINIREDVQELARELRENVSPTIVGTGSMSYPASDSYPVDAQLSALGSEEIIEIDPERAAEEFHAISKWYAYDESIQRYNALEGFALLTAHAVLTSKDESYVPNVLVTAYFYTRARPSNDVLHIRYSDEPEVKSQQDYTKDKVDHLLNVVEGESVLFIDGPLIAGDAYTYLIQRLPEFAERDVLPVFIVKNSESNLVTERTHELRGKYNSDMHWVHTILKPGSYTKFFMYQDLHNPDNSKIFCYLKSRIGTVLRVEFPRSAMKGGLGDAHRIVRSLEYLSIAHGDKKNPQVRPIAVAEKYAREVLKTQNLYQLMYASRINATMNQTRFG